MRIIKSIAYFMNAQCFTTCLCIHWWIIYLSLNIQLSGEARTQAKKNSPNTVAKWF